MTRTLRVLGAAAAVAALFACAQQPMGQSASAPAASGPEVSLARLDCGTGTNDLRRFTDTYAPANTNPAAPFTFSCYLIKHGDEWMVWDTGFAPGSNPSAPKVSLTQQLAQVGVQPAQIKYVGISHFHGDHTGQLTQIPGATLLIGQREWDALRATPPMAGANVAGFAPWLTGGGKVEPQAADKDVFGDGSVMILRTPGHTPGHQALLVRLKDKGPVVLLGDAAHTQENYETNGVPSFNFDRADTLASLDRIKQIEKNLKATVIVQHDPRDIGKLPAFPAFAK